MIKTVGFGGGCHWCTEAVFASLIGILSVKQGWIASVCSDTSYSEGVLVEFDTDKIQLDILIAVHLHTHSSTALHSMREKYRSAVYIFSENDAESAEASIKKWQRDFKDPIITKVLPYANFRINNQESLDYYFANPEKPFCENYINPKLKLLLEQFSSVVNNKKLSHLI